MLRQKLLQLFAALDSPAVPEQKNGATQVLEQVFDKGTHLQSVEIPAAKLCIERQTFPLGRKSKGADGRDPIPFVRIIENGGFPGDPTLGARPGSSRTPIHRERSDGRQVFALIFKYGHRFRFQRSICSSLRCKARRSGFSQLHPIATSYLHTWLGR
jgi:hypothetical protein